MANVLPPPPILDSSLKLSYAWQEWFRQLRDAVNPGSGTVAWALVNKAGANITDIPTRLHNTLQGLQGGAAGDYNHVTTAQLAALTAIETIPVLVTSGGTGLGTTPSNGQVLIGNGTDYTLNTITAGSNVIVTNAAGSISIAALSGAGPVTGTATNFSGTSNLITGLPFTLKRIQIAFAGMQTSGTSLPILQIGPSGGLVTTGYLGAVDSAGTAASISAGFNAHRTWASTSVSHGCYTLTLIDSATNTWACTGTFGNSNSASTSYVGGSIALSGALERFAITTVGGTNTFSAGSFNYVCD